MLRTFIQSLALFLVIVSTIFFYKGTLSASAADIAKQSSTMWGYNLAVGKALATQRADTLVGVILLMLSAVLQMVNTFWPMRIGDFSVSWKGVIVALVAAVILWFGMVYISKKLQERQFHQVESILKKSEA